MGFLTLKVQFSVILTQANINFFTILFHGIALYIVFSLS